MNGRQRVGISLARRTSSRDVMALVLGGRRFEVLLGLADGERDVTSLCERLSMSMPHVSQELSLLASHGLVRARQFKRTRFYRLTELVSVVEGRDVLSVTFFGADGTRVVAHLHDAAGRADISSVLQQVREDTLGSGRLRRLG